MKGADPVLRARRKLDGQLSAWVRLTDRRLSRSKPGHAHVVPLPPELFARTAQGGRGKGQRMTNPNPSYPYRVSLPERDKAGVQRWRKARSFRERVVICELGGDRIIIECANLDDANDLQAAACLALLS